MEYPEMVMGFCTLDHMAYVAGVTKESLRVMIANDHLPPLPAPAYKRLGERTVFTEEAVEEYRLRVERWRADAPARAAEKAAEKARRDKSFLERMEQDSARLKREHEAHRSNQIAQELAMELAQSGRFVSQTEITAELERRMKG